MSQSNSNSGSSTPKDSARTHRHRPDTLDGTTDGESASEPEPACRSRSVGHSVEGREWCEKSFTDRIPDFYQPCGWPECFPDGSPDATDVETFVRSCHHPTTYHRPRDADDAIHEPAQNSDEAAESTGRRTTVCERINSVIDLRDGDGVIWTGQSTPMHVVNPAAESDGIVSLVGPDGGEYYIEGRPDCARPYYVRGFGCRHDISRVVPADGGPGRA